jgi:hypothetical protein
MGVRYVVDLAGALAAEVEPVSSALGRAAPAAPPINWSVRSFDLVGLDWVDGLLPDTAYEYRSRYGQRKHLVRGSRRTLLQLDRRNAVYAAASLHRVPLLVYDERSRTLSVPRTAPMPEAMARTAAACAGAAATEHNGRLVYSGVPAGLARVLMVAAGQRAPEPRRLPGEGSRH